jgi:aminomethyltransferase
MKQTALHEIHKALGAKMVPFAGYEMPVQYDGVNVEHLAVRNSIGVFDVSHMGEFLIEGPNALDLVQSVCSNDCSWSGNKRGNNTIGYRSPWPCVMAA